MFVETLGIFVVIAPWFVCVYPTLGFELSNLQLWRTNLSEGHEGCKTFLITLEPPPPPQRRRLDTDGSFEPIGVSEVPGEPALVANRFDFKTVEI